MKISFHCLKCSQILNVHNFWATFWQCRWCWLGENWHFSLLQTWWNNFASLSASLTWSARDEGGTALSSTSLFFCSSFIFLFTELTTLKAAQRTIQNMCTLPFTTRKTFKNAFGKILNAPSLFPYKHGDSSFSSFREKKKILCWNNLRKQFSADLRSPPSKLWSKSLKHS